MNVLTEVTKRHQPLTETEKFNDNNNNTVALHKG